MATVQTQQAPLFRDYEAALDWAQRQFCNHTQADAFAWAHWQRQRLTQERRPAIHGGMRR
jgi:hypothetical protein